MTTNSLTNPDLAPVPAARRTWTAMHFFSLWVGMAVCIPTYMIAASLIQGGMDWQSALLTVLLGNCIVLVPMLLNGHAGAKYGIPFPILARASFGTRGSNLPAMLRAIVACGWFGIQCWIGGAALYTMLLSLWPGAAAITLAMPAFIGVGALPFACFLVFWAIHIGLMWKGIESIKYLETLCAPFLLLCGVALLVWAYRAADGFGPMLAAPSRFATPREFWNFFFPALTGMVGFWATLSLNISDFSRYSTTQRAQVVGQTLGLPTTMTLFAFIGIAVTSATIVIFGEPIWDPVGLAQRFDSPLLVAIAMFAVLIATLSTNVAANIVGPANDFSNLAPAKINFKRGGYITGVLGIVMMPWKLLADPTGYIFTWLIGYSALLGPVAAILLVDYFVIRRARLVVADLYRADGIYRYTAGWNLRAVVALCCGVLPNVPGFLAQIGVVAADRFPTLNTLYHYAWFIGFAVAGATYYALMARSQARAQTAADVRSEVA